MDEARKENVKKWLFQANDDLKCTGLLYDNRLFSGALYHLQQSNEKLEKGLLLWFGILTPKTTKKDLRIKSNLGFLPKEPQSYGHRTMKFLLSDLDKSIPEIEKIMQLLKHKDWEKKIVAFQNTIQKSKKGIKKLRKKPFSLIENAEQLEKEVKAAEDILETMDQTIDKVSQDIEKLDFSEIVGVALDIARKEAFNPNNEPLPTFNEIKNTIIETLKIAILISLTAAVASFLNPLVSATRYPDSKHIPFNETNPYVANFNGLYGIVAKSLEKSRSTILKTQE